MEVLEETTLFTLFFPIFPILLPRFRGGQLFWARSSCSSQPGSRMCLLSWYLTREETAQKIFSILWPSTLVPSTALFRRASLPITMNKTKGFVFLGFSRSLCNGQSIWCFWESTSFENSAGSCLTFCRNCHWLRSPWRAARLQVTWITQGLGRAVKF